MPEPQITTVEDGVVTWRLTDPDPHIEQVRLWSDFDLGPTAFRSVPGGWELRRESGNLPPVDRLEYLFGVTAGEETDWRPDSGNPLLVGGAFGDHSWVSLGYQAPAWLGIEPVPGTRGSLTVDTTVGAIDVEIWAPADARPDLPLPLLLSHDGPEMDSLGELTRFVGSMIASGRLPALRVGLLAPGRRDERYAANPAYADALVDLVLPAITARAPTDRPPVLMGQSLGALAALHAEWTHPGTFGGLLLQSGSFFTPQLDAQESGFAHWKPVTDFVAEVLVAAAAPSPVPVTVCFGSAEENAGNNRLLAARLAELGCDVSTGSVRDGHNFTCWRDLLDPHLVDLLGKA